MSEHSRLVIGAAQFGLKYGINNQSGQVSSSEINNILDLAWKNNIEEIDTAQDYGNSEEVLGNCLSEFKKNFIIHSKFTLREKSIQDSINQSLGNLKIPRLGYFYFHRFSDYIESQNKKATNHIFENCAGLAVSVYELEEMRKALDDKFIKAIQLPLNLLDSSEEKIKLIREAQGTGKKIYIRSVFLQGLFFMDEENLPAKLSELAQPLKILKNICKKNNLDMKSLALGYAKNVSLAEGILIGVETKTQLQENIDGFKTNLSSATLDEISNLEIKNKKLLLPKNWN